MIPMPKGIKPRKLTTAERAEFDATFGHAYVGAPQVVDDPIFGRCTIQQIDPSLLDPPKTKRRKARRP